MERMQNFKSSNDPIDVQLVGAAQATIARKEKEREENGEIVRVIFDVIRHLAKQNNAFRGHDESDAAENHGNFLEELNFLEGKVPTAYSKMDTTAYSECVLLFSSYPKRNDKHFEPSSYREN